MTSSTSPVNSIQSPFSFAPFLDMEARKTAIQNRIEDGVREATPFAQATYGKNFVRLSVKATGQYENQSTDPIHEKYDLFLHLKDAPEPILLEGSLTANMHLPGDPLLTPSEIASMVTDRIRKHDHVRIEKDAEELVQFIFQKAVNHIEIHAKREYGTTSFSHITFRPIPEIQDTQSWTPKAYQTALEIVVHVKEGDRLVPTIVGKISPVDMENGRGSLKEFMRVADEMADRVDTIASLLRSKAC